jgi:hypothetical protein
MIALPLLLAHAFSLVLFMAGRFLLVYFECCHHVFSSNVADNHAKRKAFRMRVFLKDVQG